METMRICPNCRKPLPPDVPMGLCPECLIKSGFPTEGGPGAPGEAAGARFVPPPVEEIVQLFPQLEILSLIGKGGMGAVYKARQPMLDRIIALKVLPPAVAGDPGFAERFNREARALARLNHPNIVAVYDFGKVENLHYLLMEFVDGTNLRQVEQSGKLSSEQALTIVPKICEALQYAHDQGVVHRDIKPENILLDKSGRVKIADFGIAKMVGQGPTDVSLTGAKDVVGTPHYMAPEQIEKPQEVDHRADIYSLGVVFYEMLTGELPLGKFEAPSKKVHVDVRLDEVVLHTLEKEPSRRYQHVSQVKTDVETITGIAGKAGATSSSFLSQAGQTSSDKVLFPAFLMATFFGLFGAHRFYVGKIGTAFVQLGALGACIALIIACATGAPQPTTGLLLGFLGFGCVIWTTMDWILIVCKAFTDGQGRRMTHWLHPQNGIAKTDSGPITGPPSGSPPGGVPPVAGVGSPPPPMAPKAASAVSTGIIVAPALALLITASLKLAVALGSFATDDWPRNPGFLVVLFMILPALGALWGAFNMLRLRSYGWAIAGAVFAIIAPPWYLLGVPVGIWALIVLVRQDVREEFARVSVSSSRQNSPWPWLVGAGIGLVLVVICIMAVVSLVRDIVAEKPTFGESPAGIEHPDKTWGPSEPEAAAPPPTAKVAPPPAAPVVNNAASASGFQPIRIKAGSSRPMVDHAGNWWLSDQGFAGGDTTVRPDLAVVNTGDPELYRSERYGMNSFSYPVPNGKYQVKLHFAETYDAIAGPGKRVFTFIVEGHEFKDFDVWAEAGGAQRACVKTVDVEVTDGTLSIYFVPERQNPQINGIEILPVAPAVASPATPPSADDNSSVTMNITSPGGRVVIAITNGASPSDKVQIETDTTDLTAASVPLAATVPPAPAGPSATGSPEMPAPTRSAGTWNQPRSHRENMTSNLSTSDPFRQDYNKTLPLSTHGRLHLDNINGRIEVAGWDRNEVVIKALKHGKTQESVEAIKIQVDSSPDKISIHTVQPSAVTGFPSSWFWFGGTENKASVDYLVQVPQQAQMDKIDSVNGNILIDGVQGDTETSTVNGKAQVLGAAGNLKVSTVNGRMEVELVSLGGRQSVSLDTVNGAIQAILPENANARVTADTVNGGMSSEFPELVVKKQFPVSKHLKGTLGNGSATVQANTVNGSIHFERGNHAR
jgi:TM2 domain-containing membrane protein YozV/predicted Ser/Thr protein kinase